MDMLYEKYHSNRKLQKRIIGDKDYTYQVALGLLRKYGIRNKRVLDIGCGVGAVDFYLVNKGAKVLGIDISRNGINMAIKNAKHLGISRNLRYKVIDFPNQYPTEKFDIVLCSEILEHLPNAGLAVKRIKNLLKPNGIVIGSSPSSKSPLYRLGLLERHEREAGHLRRYTKSSFKNLFIVEDLKVVELVNTQGVLREFLFVSKIGSLLLRIINKEPFATFFTFLDNLMIPIFGETGITIVATR